MVRPHFCIPETNADVLHCCASLWIGASAQSAETHVFFLRLCRLPHRLPHSRYRLTEGQLGWRCINTYSIFFFFRLSFSNPVRLRKSLWIAASRSSDHTCVMGKRRNLESQWLVLCEFQNGTSQGIEDSVRS